MEVLHRVKLIAPQGHHDDGPRGIESAVAAMKLGAVDFIEKPLPHLTAGRSLLQREGLDDSMPMPPASS